LLHSFRPHTYRGDVT